MIIMNINHGTLLIEQSKIKPFPKVKRKILLINYLTSNQNFAKVVV